MTKIRSAALAALLAIGASGAQAAVVTGTSAAFGNIPDNDPAGVTRTISIAQDVEIADVDLGIADFFTSYVGDIILRLRSPAGTEIDLISQPVTGNAFDSTNLGGSYGFDDGAGRTFLSAVAGLSNNQTLASGTYRPASALAAFNGERSAGIWSVFLSDNFIFDEASAGTATLTIASPSDGGGVSPIPLPAAMPLLALGLGALGVARRRRP